MTVASIVQIANTTSASASTSATINLPSGLTVGNTLFLVLRKDSSATTLTLPAGWTLLDEDYTVDSSLIAWHEVDGSEGSTITVTHGATSSHYAAIVAEINAADPSTNPPEKATKVTGSSTAPNSGSLTPSGGSNDYLYLTTGGWQNKGSNVTTWPTNYTLNQTETDSGGAGNSSTDVVLAGRQITGSTSEDPGAFTLNASNGWTMWTVAFYPIVEVGASRQQMFGDAFRFM